MPRASKANYHRMKALAKAREVKRYNKENVVPWSGPSASPAIVRAADAPSSPVEETRSSREPSLSHQLIPVISELEILKTTNLHLEEDLKDSRSSLETCKHELDNQAEENRDLKTQSDDLRRRLHLSERQVKRAKDSNVRLRAEANQHAKKVQDAEQGYRSVDQARADAWLAISQLWNELAHTQEELMTTRALAFRLAATANECTVCTLEPTYCSCSTCMGGSW